jgi:dihydrofolate reductase
VRLEAGLGDGGERLHEWAFNNPSPRSRQIMERWQQTGAAIFGRTTYDLSLQYWGADGPVGAARVPVVVVSHSVPKEVPPNHVYTFVNGVEAAYETAQRLAGDKDISITGADVAQQFIKHGFIDELFIHLVPVLFGSGTRLFEGLGDRHVELEPIEVIETPEATHLRYRVVKDKR